MVYFTVYTFFFKGVKHIYSILKEQYSITQIWSHWGQFARDLCASACKPR